MSDSTGGPPERQLPPEPPTPTGWAVQQPPPQAPPPGWGSPPPPPSAPPVGWAPPPPAPRPGVVPLRPLTVADVLEGAWGVYRRGWRLLLPVSTVLALLTGLAAVPYTVRLVDTVRPLLELDYENATASAARRAVDQALAGWGWLVVGMAVYALVSVVALSALSAFVALVTGEAVLGRPATWSTLWPGVRSRIGSALGTGLLIALAALTWSAVLLGLGWLFVVAFGAVGVPLAMLVALGTVPLWLVVLVRWVPAVPASVLERATPTVALRRAWRLVAGQWWRTFGLLVLLGLIYAALSTVISTPLSMVAEAGNPTMALGDAIDPDAFLALMLVSVLATAVTNALVYPFTVAAVVLKYLDLRFRTEDLAGQLAEAADDVRS